MCSRALQEATGVAAGIADPRVTRAAATVAVRVRLQATVDLAVVRTVLQATAATVVAVTVAATAVAAVDTRREVVGVIPVAAVIPPVVITDDDIRCGRTFARRRSRYGGSVRLM